MHNKGLKILIKRRGGGVKLECLGEKLGCLRIEVEALPPPPFSDRSDLCTSSDNFFSLGI